MMLMVRVRLAMFELAMFSDTPPLFFGCFSIDEGGCIRWHWDYCDCYRACDVRGARVGCLIFTLADFSVRYRSARVYNIGTALSSGASPQPTRMSDAWGKHGKNTKSVN